MSTDVGARRRVTLVQRVVEPLAVAFSVWNRRRKVERIAQVISAVGARSVLLVGVTDISGSWENAVEQGVAAVCEKAVACGLQPPRVRQWDRYVVGDALCLPFAAGTFDLVVSNAVIEHVGGEAEQDRFVAEHVRVGTHWIITTPNRWFPVESHTRTVLRHWSPAWRATRAEFTRLLSLAELRAMLPPGTTTLGSPASATFMALSPGISRFSRH